MAFRCNVIVEGLVLPWLLTDSQLGKEETPGNVPIA
jgi:hypothetical protein